MRCHDLNAKVNLLFYFLSLGLSFFSRKTFLDNLEANTFDTFKVEPSLMTVFEQSHTWDELIRHFVDSYVVETDKKAVSAFYDRGYIAEKLKGLETELSLD